jgi:hypothetical protein
MPAGLTNLQKRDIAIAARQAYLAWDGREAYEAVNSGISKSECFKAWKHQEQGKAIALGVAQPLGRSTCEMTQANWAPVLAHFRDLAGDRTGAQRVRERDQDNGRRIAMHKITGALKERELTLDWVATICRSKFKCTLDRASEKQLWILFYDVRKRPVRNPVERVQGEVPF